MGSPEYGRVNSISTSPPTFNSTPTNTHIPNSLSSVHPPISYQSCVLFVENNPEWDVEFVAYRAAFALVPRRQSGNDLSGHNAILTVLFPLVEGTEVWIVSPSRSYSAFLFWGDDAGLTVRESTQDAHSFAEASREGARSISGAADLEPRTPKPQAGISGGAASPFQSAQAAEAACYCWRNIAISPATLQRLVHTLSPAG